MQFNSFGCISNTVPDVFTVSLFVGFISFCRCCSLLNIFKDLFNTVRVQLFVQVKFDF